MADNLSEQLASLKIERRGGDNPPPPAQRRAATYALVALATLAVIVGVAAGWRGVLDRLLRPQVTLGDITTLSPAQADVKLMATGYVVPQRRALLAPKQPGRLEQVLVREGDDVVKGQLIASLEAADVKARLAEARAAVAVAEARVLGAKASLDDARTQLGRDNQLLASGTIGQAAKDATSSRFAVAEATFQAALAEAQSAVARADSADVALAQTRILAPFAGRIVRKLAEVGEVPTLGSPGAGAGGIAELVDFSSLLVETDVSEGRVDSVERGGPVEISLDAFAGQRFRGEVVEVRPTIDRQKATVLVRVKLVDHVAGLLPQMAARVLFLRKALDAEALKAPVKTVVPATAVLQHEGKSYVYVLSEGHVRLTPVQLGESLGPYLELINGPPPTTKVVLNPAATLRDGDAVKEKTAGG